MKGVVGQRPGLRDPAADRAGAQRAVGGLLTELGRYLQRLRPVWARLLAGDAQEQRGGEIGELDEAPAVRGWADQQPRARLQRRTRSRGQDRQLRARVRGVGDRGDDHTRAGRGVGERLQGGGQCEDTVGVGSVGGGACCARCACRTCWKRRIPRVTWVRGLRDGVRNDQVGRILPSQELARRSTDVRAHAVVGQRQGASAPDRRRGRPRAGQNPGERAGSRGGGVRRSRCSRGPR